ncbi:Glycoside hydrolase, family 19, catalytic [uncultured Caudovirales phage]|uniref:Glycoside hydrolase, family 19, catalytic n=1 Tax=uncultured Caudovirales phage TaxID=2100421 RepID=A0A6J5MDN0_9CAUD|nr:Glycoside hydrolase, family 19, catalytic [uncultured Caudovirales phage]
MGSTFSGLSEALGPNNTKPNQSSRKKGSERILLGHVLDVILDESSPYYSSEYGVGGIRFRVIPEDYRKDEKSISLLAFPADRTRYQVPLPGEQVVVYPIVSGKRLAYAYGGIVKQSLNIAYSSEPFLSTTAFNVDGNILDALVEEEVLALRFRDKLQIPYEDYENSSYGVTSLREGDTIFEGRFGSSILFTSTMDKVIVKEQHSEPYIGADDISKVPTTEDGDPVLIIQARRKELTNEPYLIKPSIKEADSIVYMTSTQTIPMEVATSRRMDTWNIKVTKPGPIKRVEDLESTRLQATVDGIYDPNFRFQVNLNVTGFVGGTGGFDIGSLGSGGSKDENIRVLINAMTQAGITNPFSQVGILGVIGKECGFIPKDEYGYGNTSNARLRHLFGSRLAQFDEPQLEALKKRDEDFYDYIYGYLDKTPGKEWRKHTEPGDGWKYRGRGFNQITFKASYEKYGKMVGVDLVADPNQLNNIPVAATLAVKFLLNGIAGKNIQREKNSFTSVDDAVYWFVRANHGGGEVRGSEGHLKALDIANKLYAAGVVGRGV